jgi:uncharacterized protein YbjT (DUF2867 family)
MFVVSGATGSTGSQVAETLLSRGRAVTVLVRDPAKGETWQQRGAKVSRISLEDTEKLSDVLNGAEGFYALLPPKPTAPDLLGEARRMADALAGAIGNGQVRHTVLLSSIGAQHATGTGPIVSLHYAEEKLGSVADNLTALRAPYFLTNWFGSMDRANGVLHNFLTPDRKIPMIAPQDIGRFAAEALLGQAHGRAVKEIAGPEDYSPEDIARITGLKLETHPIDALPGVFQATGFSADYARLVREMVEGINSGHVAYETRDVARGTVPASEVLAVTGAAGTR